jgi:FkbH-like protein
MIVDANNNRILQYPLKVPAFLSDAPADKVEAFTKVWDDYFSRRDVSLGALLSTLPTTKWLDRDALKHNAKIIIERTWTVENAIPFLPLMGGFHGVNCEVEVRPFGVLQQELLDELSPVYTQKSDFMVLLWSLDDFLPDLYESWGWSEETARLRVDSAVTTLCGLLQQTAGQYSGSILCFDFGVDGLALERQVLESVSPRSPSNLRAAINHRFREEVARRDLKTVHVLNLAGLQFRTGMTHWFDERTRLTAAAPCGLRGQLAILEDIVRFIGASRRQPRKVLLLDGDNTLWGGILGEDGAGGIQLGGDYPGNVFTEIQKLTVQFYHQGVVLGICSKNNEPDVRALLAGHSGAGLKPEHFAVWAVNLKSKSDNIRGIADRLSLGMDSFVFVDDSPAERAEVRARCPGVLVPEVPINPMELYAFWLKFNPFERVSLSREDQTRSEMYRADEQRHAVKGAALSLNEFYRQLEMKALFQLAGEKDVARVSQMSQRTNQFNATTVRMTEADVMAILRDPARKIWMLGLSDRFGDNGMVGCVVVHLAEDRATVEQLMMSCRVLKRTVEQHFLGLLMTQLSGMKEVELTYKPTPKNQMVRDFFMGLGMPLERAGVEVWVIPAHEKMITRLLQPWITGVRRED